MNNNKIQVWGDDFLYVLFTLSLYVFEKKMQLYMTTEFCVCKRIFKPIKLAFFLNSFLVQVFYLCFWQWWTYIHTLEQDISLLFIEFGLHCVWEIITFFHLFVIKLNFNKCWRNKSKDFFYIYLFKTFFEF